MCAVRCLSGSPQVNVMWCRWYTWSVAHSQYWFCIRYRTYTGPWRRLDEPVLSGCNSTWEGGMVANPGVLVQPNGTLLMAYRGLNDKGVGMAVAHTWDGPFERLNDGAAVLGPASALHSAVAEDMFMWRTTRGIEMLFHQEVRLNTRVRWQ